MRKSTGTFGGFIVIASGLIIVVILLTSQAHSESANLYSAFLPVVADQTGWITDCIDCPIHIGELATRSAQLDSSGRPHVVYGGNRLFYSYLNKDDEWKSSTILEQNSRFPTLAIDSADHPHIVFRTGDVGVWHAYHDGDSWHFEPIPTPIPISNTEDANSVSLELDSLNQPHISYIGSDQDGDYSRYKLIYAYRDGAGWHTTLIANQSGKPSLALDSEDRPYIATPGGEGLTIFYRDGSYWKKETVYGIGAGDHPSLVIGPENELHIVNESTYMLKDETGWHEESFDGEGYTSFGYADLMLDNLGKPHVSYITMREGARGTVYYELSYAYRESDSWTQETVPSYLKNPSFNTILVDSPSDVQVLIRPDNTLEHYIKQSNDWLTTTVAQSSYMNTPISFAFDSKNTPNVIYANIETLDLIYATPSQDTWTSTVVSQNITNVILCDGCPGPKAQIEIAPDDSIRISLNSAKGYPDCYVTRYGLFDGSNWNFDSIPCNFTFHSSGSGSFGVDSMNNTHLLDQGNYGYGTYDHINDSINWMWETAPLNLKIGLAVDPFDRPIIAGSPGISYAIRTDGGWVTTTVNSQYNWATDFALDSVGQPHFATVSGSRPSSLIYIFFDGDSWRKETVVLEEEEILLCSPGIAIDDAFDVHIAYLGQGGLKYTYREGNIWKSPKTLDRIVVNYGVEWPHEVSCSLELDKTGKPHIVYATDGEIKITSQQR